MCRGHDWTLIGFRVRFLVDCYIYNISISFNEMKHSISFNEMTHGKTVGSSSKHSCKRLRLDEPWHGNVLLSCDPHKLEPKQQLQEFNADFVPWYGVLVCFCGCSW